MPSQLWIQKPLLHSTCLLSTESCRSLVLILSFAPFITTTTTTTMSLITTTTTHIVRNKKTPITNVDPRRVSGQIRTGEIPDGW